MNFLSPLALLVGTLALPLLLLYFLKVRRCSSCSCSCWSPSPWLWRAPPSP